MSVNYIQKIAELSKSHVHIRNPDHVNKIIDELVKSGCESLQVLSDFDRTITKQHENGKMHASSFCMFSKCPSVTEEYRNTESNLLEKFRPVEIDPTISIDKKKGLMEEWWNCSAEALKGLKVSQEEIATVCKQLGPTLREGTKELFETLYQSKVPVLVFSAGLGDTVVTVLKQFEVLLPNVKVVSNFLKYDNDGVIQGFQDNIIHVYNKNELALQGTEFFDLVKNRPNVILLGDSLGDAGMAEGIAHSHVLKIGFLYERKEEALPSYMDTFDIVLEDDQTMAVAKAILNQIKSSQNLETLT